MAAEARAYPYLTAHPKPTSTRHQGFNEKFAAVGEMSYLIPIEDIRREGRPVAAGGGGQVYKGTLRGKQVAIKSIYSQMTSGQMEELEVRASERVRERARV